tara:strand:- start:1329 stop:1616 length:288 start_codon:yes stop_codon:yes gene_type:complete
MSCCGTCDRGDIFRCDRYIDIADKYVEFAQVANKCEKVQKEKLLWYGMGFWLMQDSNSANILAFPLEHSLIQTACLKNDCDTIRGLARLLGENCI